MEKEVEYAIAYTAEVGCLMRGRGRGRGWRSWKWIGGGVGGSGSGSGLVVRWSVGYEVW